jgi:hypothetical protein
MENTNEVQNTTNVGNEVLADVSNSVCDCSTCGTFDKCDCDNCLDYDRWRPKAN